jgi:type 1 fimbria pilin
VRMIAVAFVVAGVMAFASAPTLTAPKLNFLADSVRQDGDVLRLSGHVRIAACSVATADEGVLNVDKGEAQLSGNVRLTLTSGVDSLKVH